MEVRYGRIKEGDLRDRQMVLARAMVSQNRSALASVAFFEGRAGYPMPRRKFVHDAMRFPQPYTKAGVAIVLGRDSIWLPKFGWKRERPRQP